MVSLRALVDLRPASASGQPATTAQLPCRAQGLPRARKEQDAGPGRFVRRRRSLRRTTEAIAVCGGWDAPAPLVRSSRHDRDLTGGAADASEPDSSDDRILGRAICATGWPMTPIWSSSASPLRRCAACTSAICWARRSMSRTFRYMQRALAGEAQLFDRRDPDAPDDTRTCVRWAPGSSCAGSDGTGASSRSRSASVHCRPSRRCSSPSRFATSASAAPAEHTAQQLAAMRRDRPTARSSPRPSNGTILTWNAAAEDLRLQLRRRRSAAVARCSRAPRISGDTRFAGLARVQAQACR